MDFFLREFRLLQLMYAICCGTATLSFISQEKPHLAVAAIILQQIMVWMPQYILSKPTEIVILQLTPETIQEINRHLESNRNRKTQP